MNQILTQSAWFAAWVYTLPWLADIILNAAAYVEYTERPERTMRLGLIPRALEHHGRLASFRTRYLVQTFQQVDVDTKKSLSTVACAFFESSMARV